MTYRVKKCEINNETAQECGILVLCYCQTDLTIRGDSIVTNLEDIFTVDMTKTLKCGLQVV